MANLNQVNLIGHLTRDVELKHAPSGTAVANFGLAVNRKWRNDKGEDKQDVVFVEITAWARIAEVCSEYLHKGSPVFISGRLAMDAWIDKATNQKRSRLMVVVESMQLLAAKEANGE
jgi:single-strand DNA-binding protein